MAERKVLVLNNDILFKTKIQAALKQGGFQPIWSMSEGDALSKLAAEKPSLVILDLGFKDIDPIGMIGKIKQGEGDPGVPILAYASHVDRESRRKAQEAGADKVVARSEFSSNLPDLVARYAAPS